MLLDRDKKYDTKAGGRTEAVSNKKPSKTGNRLKDGREKTRLVTILSARERCLDTDPHNSKLATHDTPNKQRKATYYNSLISHHHAYPALP
jgi:hypothetical protein